MDHERHVQSELEFPVNARLGTRNRDNRRVQEWLSLNGFATSVDSDFGTATESSLRRFQARQGHAETGQLSVADWAQLCAPLRAAIVPPLQSGFLARLRALAQQHLSLGGSEVGGENAGPWVRLYMRGREGSDQLWCAGFVSFLLRQAAHECDEPVADRFKNYHEVSCDQMASDGKKNGLFLSNRAAVERLASDPLAFPIAIFLRRKSARDWTHVGLAVNARTSAGKLLFETVEGNSNQAASRNGGEVVSQTRAGSAYDLIWLS